jgi:hypothetical protein
VLVAAGTPATGFGVVISDIHQSRRVPLAW